MYEIALLVAFLLLDGEPVRFRTVEQYPSLAACQEALAPRVQGIGAVFVANGMPVAIDAECRQIVQA